MNNRILAMLLAIIMIVSIVPVNAFATETLVHAEGCEYRAPCNCPNVSMHNIVSALGGCTGYPCTMDCANNADPTPTPTPTPVAPAEHPHVDEKGGPTGGSNGVCDIDDCTDHVHKSMDVAAVDPTCTTGGNLAYRKCEFCDVVFSGATGLNEGQLSDYILNPVHKNLDHREAVAATCTTEGQEAHTKCTVCGKYFSDPEAKNELAAKPVISALGHNLTKVEAKEATCVEQGNWTYYKCGTCNKLYDDEAATQEVSESYVIRDVKTTHTLGDYIQDEQNGHYKACTVDGCEYTTDLIPHNTFRYENGKKICVNCEFAFDHDCVDEDNNCVCDVTKCGAELTHNIVWNSNDKGKHYQSCGNANCFKKTLTGWEDCVDTNNDCICNTCGGKMVHTLIDVEAKAATCAEDGNIAHQKCTNCNGTFDADGKPVDPVTTLDHWEIWALDEENGTHYKVCKRSACQEVLSEPEAHEVTFTTQYETEHQGVCSICNLVVTADHYDSPDDEDCSCDDCGKFLGHTLTPVAKVDAKCGVNGNVEHQLCENCGKTFTPDGTAFLDDVVIEARKHWEIWEYDAEADTHTKVCKYSTCREVLIEEEPHEFTYTNRTTDNRHNAVCSECGFTQARDHVDENKDCVCDLCGFERPHAKADLTYHGYRSPICEVAGNHGYYTCNTCSKTFAKENGAFVAYTDYVIPALEHIWGPTQSISTSTYCGDLCHIQSCLRDNCDALNVIEHVDADEDCVCDLSGKLLHSHDLEETPEQAATCTEPGHEAYFTYKGCGKLVEEIVEIPATGHDETGAWAACTDGNGHEKKCPDCDAVVATAAHDFSGEAPYCKDCNAPEGLEFQKEVPATCTQNGTKAHYKSKITGRCYWDAAGTDFIGADEINDLVILAGHDLTEDWMPGGAGEHIKACQNQGCDYIEEDTCTSEDGNCFCDVCEYPLPGGHEYEDVEFIAPTCTKPGQMAATYCATCNKYYDADGNVLKTIVINAMGHSWATSWTNDIREDAHSKYCRNYGCGQKLVAEHELECVDTLKGNLHEYNCSSCTFSQTEIHYNKDGDTLCDECGHDFATVVTDDHLDNDREVVTYKNEKDDTDEQKRGSWWNNFVDKMNPSYVGESESSSAPSASTGTSVPSGSGSGSGSGSSSGGSYAPGSGTSTGSSVIDELIQFLQNLLNTLLGL